MVDRGVPLLVYILDWTCLHTSHSSRQGWKSHRSGLSITWNRRPKSTLFPWASPYVMSWTTGPTASFQSHVSSSTISKYSSPSGSTKKDALFPPKRAGGLTPRMGQKNWTRSRPPVAGVVGQLGSPAVRHHAMFRSSRDKAQPARGFSFQGQGVFLLEK